eukprot:3810403-Alexandrium_andersonii.AAC.1
MPNKLQSLTIACTVCRTSLACAAKSTHGGISRIRARSKRGHETGREAKAGRAEPGMRARCP